MLGPTSPNLPSPSSCSASAHRAARKAPPHQVRTGAKSITALNSAPPLRHTQSLALASVAPLMHQVPAAPSHRTCRIYSSLAPERCMQHDPAQPLSPPRGMSALGRRTASRAMVTCPCRSLLHSPVHSMGAAEPAWPALALATAAQFDASAHHSCSADIAAAMQLITSALVADDVSNDRPPPPPQWSPKYTR